MSIVKRSRSSELPQENPINREAIESSAKKGPSCSDVESWRMSREGLEETGITEEMLQKNPSYFTAKLRAAGIRPRKKKVLGDITYGEVEEAIWHSSGAISAVARRLRISVYHVKGIFKRNKLLEQEFTEFRESLLDEVELALLTKIRNGDTVATLFYLKCLGKERGYIEKAENAVSKRGVKMKIVKASSAKKSATPQKKPDIHSVVPFARKIADAT